MIYSSGRGSNMAEAGASAIGLGQGPQPRQGRIPVQGHWRNCMHLTCRRIQIVESRELEVFISITHTVINRMGVVVGRWLPTQYRFLESSRALSKQKGPLFSCVVLVPVTTRLAAHKRECSEMY